MMAALFDILYLVLGVLPTAVVKLPDVKLGESVTLPCQDNEDTLGEQLEVQWWLGDHLVSRLNQDQISSGISYRNRTELPAGGISHGIYSLTITHTQHGDSGVYRCVLVRKEQKVTLGEVELRVDVPRYPRSVFAKVGDKVVLPCFNRVDWLHSEAEFVQWKRGELTVLHWEKGSHFQNPWFTGRASLAKERILQDNLSLVLKNITHEDQGLYLCLFVRGQAIKHAPLINLTVTDHMSWVESGIGSSMLLPLNAASPVSVWFLPDGGNYSACVCEVEKKQVTCKVAYKHRVLLLDGSLELKDLSISDSGTFSMIMRGTQRTVHVQFLRVLHAGDTVVLTNSVMVVIIITAIVPLLVVSIVIIKTTLKWQSQRHKPEATEKTLSLSELNKLSIDDHVQPASSCSLP